MVGSGRLAMVTDQLESADHLANGEEAQALGRQDTTSHQLCPGDVAHRGSGRAGRGGGLLRVLEQRARVLESLEEGLPVGLERREGPAEINCKT